MKNSATTQVVLNGVPAWVIVVGLLVLAFVVIATPAMLALIYKKTNLKAEDPQGRLVPANFFQLPYMTWFLIHLLVPFLGILAVVGLALAGALDTATVATLLSGLFGYVLGSAASGRAASATPQNAQQTVNHGEATSDNKAHPSADQG